MEELQNVINFIGDFHADFSGYDSQSGPGAGMPKGSAYRGGSGGGHGGRGGRARDAYYSAFAYDSLF